jgi:predicted AAA+ superfamily ATPase
MDIIRSVNRLPRLVGQTLEERLAALPGVVLTGARQTGKSTLAEDLLPGPRRYWTLDDLETLDLSRRDPEALVGGKEPITIAEVQREPNLLLAIKRAIDRDRRPGRFLLTGSANLSLMKTVSESLAGRVSHLTLWPMTHREQQGLAAAGSWDVFFETPPEKWIEALSSAPAAQPAPSPGKRSRARSKPAASAGTAEPRPDWRDLARRGGYPTPALELPTPSARSLWFDGYVRTYLERDLRALSDVSSLPDFRRLMRAVALRLGQLVQQTELSRDIGLSQPTIHRWLNLLEVSYLLVRLPAYSVNRTKRLIKSPKLYFADVGLALHLAGDPSPSGPHFENLALADLLAWRDSRLHRPELFHWRTATGEEVDLVIEHQNRLLPIEFKSTSEPRLSDTTHLRTFHQEYAPTSLPGLLIHAGPQLHWLTPDTLAIPWHRLL